MKKNLLLAFAVIAFTFQGIAQTNVSLTIHHKLMGNDFAFNETGSNSLEEDFQVDRLEYYLSGFKITYDNGQVKTVSDLYVLVNAGEQTTIDLGELNASQIEAITFSVGVDEANNHGDPSAWDPSHPLAPKSPSMHWGWAAGYRFLAIEGTDMATGQEFQLHGVGDDNYFEHSIPVSIAADGSQTVIDIDANYEDILDNITIHGGLIVHGEVGMAKRALENMRDFVFEPSEQSTSVPEYGVDFSMQAYPNPTKDGNLSFVLHTKESQPYTLIVVDILGKVVFEDTQIGNDTRQELNLPASGLYLLNLSVNGVSVHAEKIISL